MKFPIAKLVPNQLQTKCIDKKTLFWGIVASSITHLKAITVEEAEKGTDPKRDKITLLLRLHRACLKRFENDNKKLNYFLGINKKYKKDKLLVYIVYLIIFISIAIILYLIMRNDFINFLTSHF